MNSKVGVVGVVGAGLMGVGIATQCALHGLRTIVHDSDPGRLANVFDKANAVLGELLEVGRIEPTAQESAIACIETSTDLDEMVRAEFIFEAVPELLDLKYGLYRKIGAVIAPEAILASNTSGFEPDLLASALPVPERFTIAHFWNPPHLIPLVEIVPGSVTASEVTARTEALMRAIGMEPVTLSKSIPGFIGNRLQFAVLREALNIVRAGAASPEVVDQVMKSSLGRRWSILGPFESLDMGGIETFVDISSHLMPELAKDEDVIELLRKLVNVGRVGVRSGAGFYDWDDVRLAHVRAARSKLLSDD
jgi:3-hydroxybutyryl-CoA dehydrogenase